MKRLGIVIPVVLAAGGLAAFGAWYWQSAEPVPNADEPLPSRVEIRKLEVGLEAQRQHVEALNDRLDSGLNKLDELALRASALDGRYREHLSMAGAADDLPRTLEEIVAQKTRTLDSRDTADESIRIQALSGDTGIPEDRIREALGQ